MSWQILTGISVLTFSISILLRRILLHNDKSDPIAYVIVFQGLVGILTGIYAIIHGFQLPDFGKYWFAITLTVILYSLAHVTSAKALQRIEASVFSVLFATSAVWTMFIGLFLLHDSLSPIQVLGVIVIFISVVALIEDKKSLKLDRGIALGLISAALFGLAIAGWAYVGRRADVPSWTALSFLGPALLVLVIKPKSVLKMKPFLKKDLLLKMLLLGVIFSISSLASLLAYKYGNVNVVAVLQQTGIIVTTVLGIIFLHERKHLWQKAAAAVICFVGVLLVLK